MAPGVKEKMKNNPKPVYKFIQTKSVLKDLTTSFEQEKTVAVDLEADSMYHFKEKVCLVQMATKTLNVVIDPLEIKDMSPLKPIFSRPDIKKVFHGADNDIRCLYRDFDIKVNNLFDTQMACRFLGVKEIGLEAVLQQRFDVSLDKKYQKKNWSQRPLPPDMMEYAATDTLYLNSLAAILEKELVQKGRLNWMLEECEILCRARPPLPNNDPLFLKFKGAGRLPPKNLSVLEALLKLREKIAKKKDRPLFKIIGNNTLLKIAESKPGTLRHLKNLNVLSKKQLSIYADDLLTTINKAAKIPPINDLPVYPPGKVPVMEPSVSKNIKALKLWRAEKAKMLNIDPALIANNSLLCTVAIKKPLKTKNLESIKEMKNWQKKEFGNEIIAVLNNPG